MSPLDLLSVHVPKCAGTSLFRALENAYGPSAILSDYGDRPLDPAAPMNLDPDGWFDRWAATSRPRHGACRVIHGHYHIHKYRRLPARLRATFLREPVERLISHFFFWKSMPVRGHPIHIYMTTHDLGLEEFARLPKIRRCYTDVFFRGVSPDEFDFIGFHHQIQADLERLSVLVGRPLGLARANANPNPVYGAEVAEILADAHLVARLTDLLKDDIGFYERAQRRHL